MFPLVYVQESYQPVLHLSLKIKNLRVKRKTFRDLLVLHARHWPGFIFGFSTLELETVLLYPWPYESQNSYKIFLGGL